MKDAKVLVVEDEENVRRLIAAYLEREGFDVIAAADGHDALDVFRRAQPDLVILDLMLPGVDGWEVCRRIRSGYDTPVIMLTARGEELDRIKGFELGADDYITKPFSPRELVLRVRAVLRRVGEDGGRNPERLRFPGLEIDRVRRTCRAGGRPVELTRREFDLLWFMAASRGRALEREELLMQLWGYDYAGDPRTIDVHVTRLRDKLEKHGWKYLHTVWGVGYKFEPVEARDRAE